MAKREGSKYVIETCNRFLEAAEKVYLENGYYGTSVRAIAKEAHRSIGTLHHYWGGKQELFKELFETRFQRLRNTHLEQFSLLKARVERGETVQLREIVNVLAAAFYVSEHAPEDQKRNNRLFSRVYADPAREITEIVGSYFNEPIRILIELLRHACPHLDPREFRVRVLFVMNMITHQEITNYSGRFDQYMPYSDLTNDQLAESVVSFVVHALSAPATLTSDAVTGSISADTADNA